MHTRWFHLLPAVLLLLTILYPVTCKLFDESLLTVNSIDTSADTATTSLATIILPSPTMSFSISSTSASFTSASSTSTSSTSTSSTSTSSTSTSSTTSSSDSPSPTDLPSHALLYDKKGCLYMTSSNITFTFDSDDYITTNLSHLSMLFKIYTDVVEGCEDQKVRTFKRNYFESSNSTDVKFWFQFSFENHLEDGMWTLTSLDSGNFSHDNVSFNYGNCGLDLEVPIDMSYRCSNFHCNGHERVSKVLSTIYIYDFVVDAYLRKNQNDPSKIYLECGLPKSSGNNNTAFLIVGLVIGVTLIVAVIIIISSFVYKRYRYGPYNLLD